MQTKKRPVFLDLQQIKLPIPGIVSILHRISGVILFIMLPVLLTLLNGSLSSNETFETYKSFTSHFLVKLALIGILWALMHHLFAGIRFLLLDAHKGLELQTARKTARIVLYAGIVSALVLGVALW
ncbi:MAG: succinate dehydrogenase, cytochrome b556 subunit [Neisseria sp.]|uniref:succinate dehydrogenase, cytochrome b556 subunit n=1 Tax=Neisseria sp. TaxID=192066 RepID=UPI0026DAC28F|nr:succinate dehydrogenase, cytochrome b556 subunit [Neisseria sp.]MDO4640564.1 succinate dehydrogenase, cytochrome b556 subunit [Neisseria sp.]